MPLPLILGIGAAVAGTAGVGSGIHGAVKMKKAKDTMKLADEINKANMENFEAESRITTITLDKLGKKELEILKSFEGFSDVIERIQCRPDFKSYDKYGVNIPKCDIEELKKVSIGAGLLLGGIGGAALGTAGGFAAAGATTSAVMALGAASTGTAISSLSGAAAVNATLAALGGGSLAAGGGGIALGSAILGGATLGISLLVGGIIFNITGSSLSNKAEEAWSQMEENQEKIKKICSYMNELRNISNKFYESISSIDKIYREHLDKLMNIVYINHKIDWNDFTNEEKVITENTSLFVNLLYNMMKVKLTLESENNDDCKKINLDEVEKSIENANIFLNEKGLQ
ncbi:hypothetical protein P6O24_08540 [Clostridium perfringens]|uniref:Uncharacterized protein n=2 Tax=Clostridium perfringens TaxID=1502 RepID=A0AAW4ISM8_CLOPF|nr:hypothetical protein [Clostridium perfringens]EHP50527.1 hypothetical protein HMPREF9476_00479 [Clostridium perfringens WAL-14572]ELC8417781.1 hypothetical protein [Clostridium perfringens]MBO3354278.1 hypothetical protein [Clostridium perfringens]MBO3357548.1 hypothetical protein [Clostridium perfringens]MDK0559122.1 hypothetical protein [Clostridium perfringens]